MRTLPLILAMATSYAGTATADDAISWTAAFRYRLESVEQTGFADDALAHTARLRLGARAVLSETISGVLEGEGVWAINDHFNSGANGQTRYPAVTDPSALEVNQAFLQWADSGNEVRLGRQRILLGNQRFVGNVGWRQNEQTFDAALATFNPTSELKLQFGWIDRAHRFPGDRARDPLARERDLNTALLQAEWGSSFGPLSGYFLKHEDEDVGSASSQTLGARWVASGEHAEWKFTQTIEAARQQDAANNPLTFSHSYVLLETSVGRNAWSAKLGAERLNGDGTHAFQTPLATLHAFNGWADVFTVTPNDGLQDRYASLSYAWKPIAERTVNLSVIWHDFQATASNVDYGSEWDAVVGTALARGWSISAKYADYQREDFGRDTRKIWLQVEWAR